jgi:hypothetical protein
MTAKGCLVTFMLFSFPCAYAASGSNSIGTVNARGNMRVDGYTVQGNGTLFDGTAVETSQATATLRLQNGTEITMAIHSRGIVYRDRLVLLQGQSQLKASSSSFFVEADGLRVVPVGPNTLSVVSVSSPKTFQVAAVTGELRIADATNPSLTHVSPGTVMSFGQAPGAGGANGTTEEVEEIGLVSVENGQYYLTTADGTKYLITGQDFQKDVGTKLIVEGTLQEAATPSGIPQINVKKKRINGGAPGRFTTKAGLIWFTTAIAAAGTGLGIGIYEATKPSASP